MPSGIGKALKDRRVQIGLAVAAGLGLVVLARRGDGSGGGGEPVEGGGAIANPALADTTGADLANILGQYSGDLSAQLAEYRQTLTDALEGLQPDDTGTGDAGGPTGFYSFASGISDKIKSRYDPQQVAAAVLAAGGSFGGSPNVVDPHSIVRALQKRGYRVKTRDARQIAAQTKWIDRLLAGQSPKKK